MFCSRSVGRGGVTLVEMMIAMIITLMIVFAMVEAFRRIGETTTDGRAVIEMLGQMRSARSILENDVSRCTIPPAMRDPRTLLPDQYHGGFELIEGAGSDTNPGRFFVRVPDPANPGYSLLKYNFFNFGGPTPDPLVAQSQTLFGDLDLWWPSRKLCLAI
jgi:type II secretory pathway component PulJ